MNFVPTLLTYAQNSLALIGALIGFGLLVTVHEFGHFIFCKLFGIHTPTFSIGMGPIIYQRKIGTTNFALSALPLGGYVEMAGLSEIAQGDQAHAKTNDSTSFQQKPYWQRFLVLIGGISFNMLFAYGVFISLFAIGMPTMTNIEGVKIISIRQNSAAEKHGLKKDDLILGIEHHTFKKNKEFSLQNFLETLQKSPHKTIHFSILRNKKTSKVKVTLEARKEGETEIGMLGASFEAFNPTFTKERVPLFTAFKQGWNNVNRIAMDTIQSYKLIFAKRNLDGAGGPVLILSQSFKSAQQGISFLLIFLAYISIGLAIMNLLPLGALDGGQLLFTTIEAIIRRPLPDVVRLVINVSSLLLFAALFLYLTYFDILKILGW